MVAEGIAAAFLIGNGEGRVLGLAVNEGGTMGRVGDFARLKAPRLISHGNSCWQKEESHGRQWDPWGQWLFLGVWASTYANAAIGSF